MTDEDDEVAALMSGAGGPQAMFELLKDLSSAEEFGAGLGDWRADQGGTNALGVQLAQRGDWAGAEAAWLRADEQGDADATVNLGTLFDARGQRSAAEAAFGRADERGHPRGATERAKRLFWRGDAAAAEAAFRRADERGDAAGATGLGLLLQQRGDISDALAAYLRADERGDAAGACNVGAILASRGDEAGAEAAWRRADERGDASAANNVGLLLSKRGDASGAEAAFRRGDERGQPDSSYHLAIVLARRGDRSGAEAALHRADEVEHPEAALTLGVFLQHRGDIDGAKAAYARAEARGVGEAAHHLGMLLQETGDVAGAEDAYRRADAGGNAAAACNLGALLHARGDLAGAEAAFRRASEGGDVGAARNLTAMLAERGDQAGAQAATRQAEALASRPGSEDSLVYTDRAEARTPGRDASAMLARSDDEPEFEEAVQRCQDDPDGLRPWLNHPELGQAAGVFRGMGLIATDELVGALECFERVLMHRPVAESTGFFQRHLYAVPFFVEGLDAQVPVDRTAAALFASWIHDTNGDVHEAMAALEGAEATDPVILMRSSYATMFNRYREVLEITRSLPARAVNPLQAFALIDRGCAIAELGMPADGLAVLDGATDAASAAPFVLDRLNFERGRLCAAAGQLSSARRHLLAVRESNPGYPGLAHALDSLPD